MNDIQALIKEQISTHPVVLYMKGTPEMPQCGFSRQVVLILESLGVKPFTVDVLANNEMRQGIKDYSNWPTLPQLYVRGEFIGGCDIVSEMHERGALQRCLYPAS